VASSSPRPRSVSLSGQLIVFFVVLIAATVAGLTIIADRSAIANLESQAQTAVQTAAQTQGQLLTQLLDLRLRRAKGFLITAESFCSESDGKRLAYAGPCMRMLLPEFQTTEQATGATLFYRNRPILSAGDPIADAGQGNAEGSTLLRTSADVRYVTRAVRGDSVLILEFDDSDVTPLFTDRTGPGKAGEVILIQDDGRPLTRARYTQASDSITIPAQECHTRPAETERNYRGDRVFAFFAPVSGLPGACIVAYMDYQEALGPASDLRLALITRGTLFVLAGVLLSLIAARHIAAPVQRLAETARALQSGDFSQRVPVDGPREVQGLGRAVAAMSNALAELLSQEQSGRRAAEAANRSKDQFLAVLSHELRTPLTAVLGWAHTLRTGTVDSERVQRAATAIERSAESQRRLIDDLLDVTGIAAGRVRMNLETIRLAEPIDAAVDAVRPRAAEKEIHLETSIEDPQVIVEGDAQRLQQVVWNLVWNAVKFTPTGGRVTVQLRAVDALAELTVTDTGIGIDPEFLPHVFGWFRREDRENRAVDEGLGLGLALVRQLVELHGGNVHASSNGRAHGSTFVVTIPITGHESGLVRSNGTVGERSAPLTSVRVLVVDDDPASREAVRALLEQVGAQVATATSADDARHHLRTTAVDVMVSDIAMAQESGYALMQTLRAEGLTLPSLALTGYARREDADKAYAAGFDVHLPKPVDPTVLVTVLAAMTRGAA
jgi:signal transduction histidine kinase